MSLSTSTPRNGPNGFGSPSPRISARNSAETRLSRAETIVWLSWTAMTSPFPVPRISSQLDGFWRRWRSGARQTAGHRRGGGTLGPGRVGHPFLRGQGPDPLGPHRRRAAPVPPRRPAPAGLHPGRAAGRAHARRDRRGAGPPPARRRPDGAGVAAAVGRVAPAARRAHLPPHRPPGPGRPLHPVRGPPARPGPAEPDPPTGGP